MQYTPNYNLITVEGTDVVNPLVQMNPNFTDIDAAMFANKQAVIGSASEIASGTVHAITRANPDSNYFRYTATSNWNAGDSMTVDGVSVSVFLPDGTLPGAGAYIINSEVFGMISGTRVTVFLSNPVTSLAADHITFDPTGTTLDPSITDVDAAIKALSGRVTRKWYNPNPSAAFAAQTITLSDSDYDMLLWITSDDSVIVLKGMDATVSVASRSSGQPVNYIRAAAYADAITYNVTGCNGGLDDGSLIPIAVYGIKI